MGLSPLLAFLAYLPALRGGMLWDDSAHITRPDLQSLRGLWRIWFDLGATQQYYPLLHSAFWVEHALWSDAVLGYHLVNVTLHVLAAFLVMRIARRLDMPNAWLAGLIFALHPLCVESVAWISEQKTVLSAVFYLSAALLYFNSRYFLALGVFILALLSKSVTATLPAALLIVIWWKRGRIEWKPLAPFFALGAVAGLFTAYVEHTYIGATGADFALGPVQRLLLAGRATWFYAFKTVVPANLTFFYPRWNIDPAVWWQWLFPIGVLAVVFATKKPRPAALIFIATLFPALGFVNVYPFRYSYVADHFAYLAILAILVPLARWKPLVLLVPVLCFLTWSQASDYKDEEILYRATLARNPDAWLAHNNLGNLLLSKQPAEAMEHFQEALRLKPDFWEAHLSFGNALLTSGRLNDAIAEYEKAAELSPNSERTQTNLGNALIESGRITEAIPHLESALRIDPNNADAHNDLGNAFLQSGRLLDALHEYQAALRANPDFAQAHNNLGRALAMAGRLPDAIAQFQEAIRIQPDYFSAHSNLGNALSQVPGRLPDAITEYRAALRIRPDSAVAHNNLGYALSKIPGRLPEAIAEYRRALELDPNYASARANLAAAQR